MSTHNAIIRCALLGLTNSPFSSIFCLQEWQREMLFKDNMRDPGHLVICSLHTLPALSVVALEASEGTPLPNPQSIHL